MSQIRKRMTYAIVMSTIAVFLVLGGATAFAASKIGANQIKAGAVVTGKIKNNAVTAAKLRNNSVTTAKIANDAVNGAKVNESTLGQVPSAKNADFATSSNPEVFAQIGTNGTVNPALAKGLSEANVTHPGEGIYCITVPAFSPRGGQVTPQFGGSSGTTANITIGGTGNCPSPAVQVLTFSGGAAPAFGSLAFYVELYR
jgi:hypothetical protein